MALQWVVLGYVVVVEAVFAILVTLPSPKGIKTQIVSLTSRLLQLSMGIVPFALFQLMDIYWKNEHRLSCSSAVCTASERDRYERAVRILCIYSVCKYQKEIRKMEEVEKRLKES
ncbi:unnamed protein product [Victoria cruziana]